MARDEASSSARPPDGVRGLLPGPLLLEAAGRSRGCRRGGRGTDRRPVAVYLESSLDGMWLGQMTLDPVSGSIVSGELERLERLLFEADCTEARERLGRTARIDELSRTSAQRRADALVEMATRSSTAPADGIRPVAALQRPRGLRDDPRPDLRARERHGALPVHPRPWMDSAYFERAIFTLGTRIDVSVRSRLFTGGTRRAIEPRDRMCTHPYCYEPAEVCQGDHVTPWAEGGETTQENGRLLCGFHNRLRNARRRHPAGCGWRKASLGPVGPTASTRSHRPTPAPARARLPTARARPPAHGAPAHGATGGCH